MHPTANIIAKFGAAIGIDGLETENGVCTLQFDDVTVTLECAENGDALYLYSRVCGLPEHTVFGPAGQANAPEVTMTVDEYETVEMLGRRLYTGGKRIAGEHHSLRLHLGARLHGLDIQLRFGNTCSCHSHSEGLLCCRNVWHHE